MLIHISDCFMCTIVTYQLCDHINFMHGVDQIIIIDTTATMYVYLNFAAR